jgi:outer membrane protein assembly factor BamB
VSFGSEGLFAYDLAGELIWKQDLGVLDGGWTPDPKSHWGYSSSPVIYRDLVIVQADVQSGSFLAAYDLADGRQVWRTPRDEDSAWSSPTIYDGEGGPQLLVSGTKFYRGYDPASGRELWRLADGADVKIPTPVAAHGLFFFGGGSSHTQRLFYAVRATARGEIALPFGQESNEHVAWKNRAVPHVLTPIVYAGLLYVATDAGVLTIYDATTGEQKTRARIGSKAGFYSASPVAADGRLYFGNEEGDVHVVRAGSTFERLATNTLGGEGVVATPALAPGTILIRGERTLFALGTAQ